mgnify:CR=1 FL=1
MEITMQFDVEETIRRRKSVRSYDGRPLAADDRDAIEALIEALLAEESPFPAKMHIRLLEAKPGTDTEHLGTYGVIRGATAFLGVTAENTPTAPEAVGYTFEKLVLAAAAAGLGTCWMAGTFDRAQFAGLLGVGEDEIFPIISPIGYPVEKKALIDSVFRKVGKSDSRKPWAELFSDGSFGVPLDEARAGAYAFPLEMLRLAPSAANRQPWRVVRADGGFHFFRQANPKTKYAFDLQRLDTGIAACHFELAARDRGLTGGFVRLDASDCEAASAAPADMTYLFSWTEA